jgi:hypothetical protein
MWRRRSRHHQRSSENGVTKMAAAIVAAYQQIVAAGENERKYESNGISEAYQWRRRGIVIISSWRGNGGSN